MFGHILLPTDGSDLATTAVDKGLDLAKALGARVTFVTVVEPFHIVTFNPVALEDNMRTYEEDAKRHVATVLAACEEKAKAAGVPCRTVSETSDQPAAVIAGTAEAEGADLIAMASHGRRGLSALMLGSQTSRVLALAKVPVLVMR